MKIRQDDVSVCIEVRRHLFRLIQPNVRGSEAPIDGTILYSYLTVEGSTLLKLLVVHLLWCIPFPFFIFSKLNAELCLAFLLVEHCVRLNFLRKEYCFSKASK
jgi:hypothetical protein